MSVNKVYYGDEVVMDISDSTVTEETLMKGTTAYSKTGEKITGELEPVLYTEQQLTNDQKNQARTNIGAASDEAVSQLSEEIADLTVPDYVKAEAEEVADKIIKNRTANSLVLLMGTDIHWIASEHANYENSRTAIKHIGMGMTEIRKRTKPDAVVLLGDYVYNVTPLDKEQAINAMRNVVESLYDATNGTTAIWLDGNHDYFECDEADKDYRLTDGEHYALVGANNSQDVEVDVENLTRNYGYVDFKKQRIRLIYLNTTDISGGIYSSNHITNIQGQWLINTLLDMNNKSDADKWAVVVCSHFPIYATPFTELKAVLGAFVDKTSGTNYGISYSFADAKSELLATFHGHIHNFKVTDVATNGGNTIKAICIPNGCPDRENPYTGDFQEVDESGNAVSYPKTAGTAEDTSFNAVIIDRENSVIRAICYGAGYDRTITGEGATPEVVIINQIPISTDASGAIYGADYNEDGVNDGYKEGTRIGSDGTDRTNAATDATGFIPVTQGDIVYLENCEITGDGTAYNQFVLYKADKTYINGRNTDTTTMKYWGAEFDDNNNLIKVTMSAEGWDLSELAFVRFTGNNIDGNSIITVNQPIE